MDSIYLLVPLSVVLVLGIGGLLAWAVMSGQFDDLEAEGRRVIEDPADDMDATNAAGSVNVPAAGTAKQESS